MNRILKRLIPLLLSLCLLTGGASAASSFPDVAPGSPYAAAVSRMAAKGLLSGYPDGRFYPSGIITAAQFVTVAARCAGLKQSAGQTAHWAAGFLQAALEAGWYDWDELPPTGELYDRPIPRQLAVKILMRALLPEVRGDYLTESRKIRDFSRLSGRCYEPVLAAYAAGVVRGDARGNFNPAGSLSRGAACILFQNALDARGGAGSPPDTSNPVPDPNPNPDPAPPVPSPGTGAGKASGGVSEHGWLRVEGTRLLDQAGEPAVLRGMSSHGIQWFSQYTGAASIANTARYGANLFRVAVYTEEGGWLSDPKGTLQRTVAAADNAIANDLYVILDWHILSDGNPMTHLAEAKDFFTALAERYGDNPAVLYEICNEPNGDVTWDRDIKPYAEQIIPVIRARAPRSVILVGSSTWSQDLHLAARSPLAGENLMYTLHFYAGTHGAQLRQRVDGALKAGLPVFVSEWGTSRADGGGGVYLEEAGAWLDFLEERGISWANWSLCGKEESSAALRPGTPPDRAWTQADLSESGKFVFGRFR